MLSRSGITRHSGSRWTRDHTIQPARELNRKVIMTQTLRYSNYTMEPTTVADRYLLVGELGEGGMGRVYRAHHIELGKVFALKVIAPAFAGQTETRARFSQEAKLASEISHPNIVSIVDYGEDPTLGA